MVSPISSSRTDVEICQGGFYSKMVNTVNKVRQYNHMVYGDPKGEKLKRV
jgi:hypothetical protein